MLEDEYKHLYGFVPLTPKQVDGYINQYFGFVDAGLRPDGLQREERDGRLRRSPCRRSRGRCRRAHGRLFPFGFIHLLRALKKNDRADLYLVAVKSEYQGSGVNAILMNSMYEVFRKLGIKKIETNPELETNHLVQGQWKYFETRQHKRRRVFIKQLG